MNQGLIQANTPQPLMGRVMAMYTLVANGMLPVGALEIVTTTYVRNAELRRLA